MSPLIKWPGGKAKEIQHIERLIPPFDRYIEPFFGGGALFFHLKPQCAVINDVSPDLMQFYALVKAQDADLRRYLLDYCALLEALPQLFAEEWEAIEALYQSVKEARETPEDQAALSALAARVSAALPEAAAADLVLDEDALSARLAESVLDKMRRTGLHHRAGTIRRFFSFGEV